MSKPFFSVVIPTLNEEDYIPRLLQSLVLQTYRSFEVIIVDADSRDGTLKIVGSYRTPFPLQLVRSQSKNVGYQRNLGAKKARGEYVLFFDADITIPKNFFFQLYKSLRKKSVDFATTTIVTYSKNILDQLSVWITNLLFYVLLKLGKPLMGGTNLIFKPEAFHQLGGFDKNVVHAEDLDLVRRAGQMGFKGEFFTHIFYVISLRRIKREGRWSLWRKYTQSFLHNLFFGAIKKPIFEYKMGGKVE